MAADDARLQAIDHLRTPSGVAFCHAGPSLDTPLPSVFYFALSAVESLTLSPFNQPAAYFYGKPCRVFSIDLPYHGEGYIATEAMRHWARDLAEDRDFLTPFFKNALEVIDYTVAQGWSLPDRLGAMGLSRGGFIATHIAAREPRIRAVVGFAPLTQFSLMTEFHEQQLPPHVSIWNLSHLCDRLTGRHFRFYIGNRDERVGTSNCYQFIHALTEANYRKGFRSPPVELHITPSIGHKGHGTSPQTFSDGAAFLNHQLHN